MDILKVTGSDFSTFFDCNAKWLGQKTVRIKFNKVQEEMMVQNLLISEKISEEFEVSGLKRKGTEDPLMVLRNKKKIDELNLQQQLTSYDEVIRGTQYYHKTIAIGNKLIKLQERVDMVSNVLNPHTNEYEIKAFTFFYSEADVKQEMTFKDIFQYIVLKEEFGDIPITLHRVNLKTNQLHFQKIKNEDYFKSLKPTLVKMLKVKEFGVERLYITENCKVCPYYDYCGIKNVERPTFNIADRIQATEVELKQLKDLGKKYCKINEGKSIKASNGNNYGISNQKSDSFAGYRGKKEKLIEDMVRDLEPEEVIEMVLELKGHISIKCNDEVITYLNDRYEKNFQKSSSIRTVFKKVVIDEEED